MTTAKVEAYRDPVAKRWKTECPHCGKIIARSKLEATEHAMTVHRVYEHEEQL
jgi:hypothetical protein